MCDFPKCNYCILYSGADTIVFNFEYFGPKEMLDYLSKSREKDKFLKNKSNRRYAELKLLCGHM